MPDRAKPAEREASRTASIQARTTRSRKALLSNKENESKSAPIAKGPSVSSSDPKARVATRAQPEAMATSTGVKAQAASKQTSATQPKLPSKPARADNKVKAVNKPAQPTLRATKTSNVPNDTTRGICAKPRKHPKASNHNTASQQQQPAEEATRNVASKATAEASVSVNLMPEGEALWERLTAQNTELNLLRVQAAAHKEALAASDKAAAEAKEAAAEAVKNGAASAKKAADLVALLHLKEVQYTKVRAERDSERVAKTAAVHALAASKLANHALIQHIKFLQQQLGAHDTENTAAAPASTDLASMIPLRGVNPLFTDDMATMIAQGSNDDEDVPAGGHTPFTPSAFLTLSTTPHSAVSAAPGDDIRPEDASAACKASAHSLSAAEAAASDLHTSRAVGSSVQSQAGVPAKAAHADSVVVDSVTVTRDSCDSTSAPASGAAGRDIDVSLASHTIANTEDQPSPTLQAHNLSTPTTLTRPGQAVVQGAPQIPTASPSLASPAVQISYDSQTGSADDTDEAAGADGDLIPYDKYLGQQPGLSATQLARAAPARTWLSATASPSTMSPFSFSSLFDFDMSLPEGKYGLHMTPLGGKSPFTPSDFLDLKSPQSAVGEPPDADIKMEDVSAACKASAQNLSAVAAAAAQFGTSDTNENNIQVQADMPDAAANADSAVISKNDVMSSGNSATPAALHAAASDAHPSAASHPTTGSTNQTSAAAQSNSPAVAMTSRRPDCTGVPGTLMASDSTAPLAVRPCHDKQTGPTAVTAAGTTSGSRQPSSTSSARLEAEALGKRRFSTANRRFSAVGKRSSAKGGLLGASDWPAGKRLKPTNDQPAVEQLLQSSNNAQGLLEAAHRQQGRATQPPQGPAQWNKAADGTAIFSMGICKPALSPLNPHRKPRVPSRAANSLRAFAATLISGDNVQANENARGMSGQEAPHPPGPFAMVFKAGLPSAPPAATTTPPIQPDLHMPAHALHQQHNCKPGIDAAQPELPQAQPAGDRATSQNDCTDAPSHVEQDQQTQKHAAEKAEPVAVPKLTQPMLPSAPAAEQVSADMQPDSAVLLQQPLSTLELGDNHTRGSIPASGTVAPPLEGQAAGTTNDYRVGTQRRTGLKRLAIEGRVSGNLDMPAGKRHKLATQPAAAGLQVKVGPFTMGAVKPPQSPLEPHPKRKSRPRRVQPQKTAVTEKHPAVHVEAPCSSAQHVGSQQMQQLTPAETTAGLAAIASHALEQITPSKTKAGAAAIAPLQQQQFNGQPLQEHRQPGDSSKDRQDITPQPQQEGIQGSSQLHAASLSKSAILQHQTQQPKRGAEFALKHTASQQLAQQSKPMHKDVSDLDVKTLKDIQQQASEGTAACKLSKDHLLPNHLVRKAQQQQPKSYSAATVSTHINSEGFGSPVKQQRRNPFAPFGLPMHTPMHQASAKPQIPAGLNPVTEKQQLLPNQLPSRLPAAFKHDQITTDAQRQTSIKHLPAAHQAMAVVQQRDGQTTGGNPMATGPGLMPAAPQLPAGGRAESMPSRKRVRDSEDEGISLLEFAARRR